MVTAGTIAGAAPAPGRAPGGDERGFTLVGLMIAVLVVNIALGVAVSSWVTIGRRAREAEAIFRGQQIARAIGCYRQQESRTPERLEELVEAGCLRRLWPDPLSRDGKWRLFTAQEVSDGTVAALLGVVSAGGTTDDDAGGPEFGSLLSGGGASASGSSMVPGSGAPSPPAASGSSSGFTTGFTLQRTGGEESTQQGIAGVAPGASGPSLRHYNGLFEYQRWVFLASSGS